MNEDAIKSVRSPGATCLKCEKEISKGDGCVLVEFKVNLVLTTTTKSEYAHPNCAHQVAMELHQAADEANRLNRK